jgi:hypothetical protein
VKLRLAILFAATLSAAPAPNKILRGADGKPDLGGDGVWFPVRLEDITNGAGYKVDVPFLPWAKAKFEDNRTHRDTDTAARCLPQGIPRLTYTANAFEILQLPNRIVFLYEGGTHIWRTVWMDGRAHPKDPNPDWLGDAVGHWEGDTLVVDSVGFNDRTWLDDAGHPHTERLHVVEKYTRTGPLAMKYEVVIDDPGAYTQSWTASTSIPFRPGVKLVEYVCAGN